MEEQTTNRKRLQTLKATSSQTTEQPTHLPLARPLLPFLSTSHDALLADDLLDLRTKAHEGGDGSDEAEHAVVEVVVAEGSGGDEDVEEILDELVTNRSLFAIPTETGDSQKHGTKEENDGRKSTHVLINFSLARPSLSFSDTVLPLLASCSLLLKLTRL